MSANPSPLGGRNLVQPNERSNSENSVALSSRPPQAHRVTVQGRWRAACSEDEIAPAAAVVIAGDHERVQRRCHRAVAIVGAVGRPSEVHDRRAVTMLEIPLALETRDDSRFHAVVVRRGCISDR